jgi:uncharacterized protein with GYD domain
MAMAKFLYRLRYTKAGLDGSIKEGFANREAFFRRAVEGLGGTTEAVYWAFGPDDVFALIDLRPDAAVGLSLSLSSTGAFEVSTTALLSAAEMDAGVRSMPAYRAPGA